MKKVIALVRTSTVAQEVESQKSELVNYIINDGVDVNNIIIVGQAGASAIKVDDEYKRNLQTVYNLIDEGNISTVYAWAIDRIGRNEEVLFQFKNKLIANGVQLVIKNPSLRLLNDDGTVNAGIELAFSLFATMAKQEMEAKKVRFARAKARNAEQGKWNGGKIHYGYSVNEEGKIVINDEEANVVRLIYDLYNSGEYSTTTLTKELQERGYTMRGNKLIAHHIQNTLKSTAFIGYTEYNGQKRTYPRIISDKVWQDAQERLKSNHKGDITKQTKHVHLASKLIVCGNCGRHFLASNRSYVCSSHKKGIGCKNNDSISVEWVDIAAWSVAKTLEIDYIYNFTESKAEQANAQIEVNRQKIATIKSKLADMENKRQRIAIAYIDGDITKEQKAKQTAKLKAEVEDYNSQIVELEESNNKLNDIATFDKEGTLIHMGRLPIMGIYEEAEEAYRITHRHIESITVQPYTHNGKVQRLINIHTVLGSVIKFLYVAKSKVKENGIIVKLFSEKDGEFTPLIATPDYVPTL